MGSCTPKNVIWPTRMAESIWLRRHLCNSTKASVFGFQIRRNYNGIWCGAASRRHPFKGAAKRSCPPCSLQTPYFTTPATQRAPFDVDAHRYSTSAASVLPVSSSITVSPSGQECSVFDARLRDVVTPLYNNSQRVIPPKLYEHIHSEPVEYWIKMVAECTLPVVKDLLSKNKPPTVSEIEENLEIVREDDTYPGIFFAIVKHVDTNKYSTAVCYVGHCNNEYYGIKRGARDFVKMRAIKMHDLFRTTPSTGASKSSKALREEAKAELTFKFYSLFRAEPTSRSTEALIRTQVVVQFAQQVFTTLFGTLIDGPTLYKWVYRNLGPWPISQYEYKGGNQTPPLLRRFRCQVHTLSREETTKRYRYLRVQRMQRWTEEMRKEYNQSTVDYYHRVYGPLQKFCRRALKKGFTREDALSMAEPFRIAARKAKKEGKPAPKPELYFPF